MTRSWINWKVSWYLIWDQLASKTPSFSCFFSAFWTEHVEWDLQKRCRRWLFRDHMNAALASSLHISQLRYLSGLTVAQVLGLTNGEVSPDDTGTQVSWKDIKLELSVRKKVSNESYHSRRLCVGSWFVIRRIVTSERRPFQIVLKCITILLVHDKL